jgi:hypothetical protein
MDAGDMGLHGFCRRSARDARLASVFCARRLADHDIACRLPESSRTRAALPVTSGDRLRAFKCVSPFPRSCSAFPNQVAFGGQLSPRRWGLMAAVRSCPLLRLCGGSLSRGCSESHARLAGGISASRSPIAVD